MLFEIALVSYLEGTFRRILKNSQREEFSIVGFLEPQAFTAMAQFLLIVVCYKSAYFFEIATINSCRLDMK